MQSVSVFASFPRSKSETWDINYLNSDFKMFVEDSYFVDPVMRGSESLFEDEVDIRLAVPS